MCPHMNETDSGQLRVYLLSLVTDKFVYPLPDPPHTLYNINSIGVQVARKGGGHKRPMQEYVVYVQI